jgi:protein-S-isoprenylcysteine O-methyltransferase Ste14
MPAQIETFEAVLEWLGAIVGLGTLAYANYNILLAQTRPTGHMTGSARQVLRTPYLVFATVIFVILGYIFWKPLPIQLSWKLRLVTLVVGGVIFFASLALYVWGLHTLGTNFNASSGFGVRLQQDHQLVTQGPYATIRHPMYLAFILACWGGLLLYLTWTMLGLAVMMLGLIYRAHREEDALEVEFGSAWEDYVHHVPGWLPKISSFSKK